MGDLAHTMIQRMDSKELQGYDGGYIKDSWDMYVLYNLVGNFWHHIGRLEQAKPQAGPFYLCEGPWNTWKYQLSGFDDKGCIPYFVDGERLP